MVKVKRKSWRDRVSLSAYLTSLISIIVLLISIILAYQVFNILKDNKYRDITSIMFLELEKQADHIKQHLDAFENKLLVKTDYLKNMQSADVIYRFVSKKTLILEKGDMPRKFRIRDFGLKDAEQIKGAYVLHFAGRSYYVKRITYGDTNQIYLYMWRINIGVLSGLKFRISNQSDIYILSKEFKIIFRNSKSIKEEGLIQRKLIQHFVGTTIRKGQFKFNIAEKGRYYGFYSEISGSNIVLFSETSETVITNMILDLLKKFAMGVLFILAFTILFIQIILPGITRPLHELVHIARQISLGNFRVRTKSRGFGEVNELMRAFYRMGHDLENRDTEIMNLMHDREERARLDQELLIAKEIQENFLPQVMKSHKDGILIGSYYKPADEVAGDWYNQFLDDKTGEFIAIVADVSGHGAGASMFTAVIAAQFEQYKLMRGENYTIKTFINNLNAIFRNLGRGEWHATIVVATVSEDRKKVTFLNCGHPFPLVLQRVDGKNKVKSIQMPSTPVGIEDSVTTNEKSIDIVGPTSCLFFTDGILEAENTKEKQFGRKKLTKAFLAVESTDPQAVIDHIHTTWSDYIEDVKPNDDICLYSMGIV